MSKKNNNKKKIENKKFVKTIKSLKSEKTGAYKFKEEIIPLDSIDNL